MAHQRYLKNAPIREAIIDLQVKPHVELSKISQLAETLKHQFPSQSPMKQAAFRFDLGPDKLSSSYSDGGVVGRRLESADGRHVVQLRTDGFTFSRLPPYESWDVMTAQAKLLWEQYVTHTGAERVTRVAVRYINVMNIPLLALDFDDYLTAPPKIPEGLPQELSGFLTQVAIVNHELAAVALVTQALESSSENKVQVILDIDVFQEAKEKDLRADDPFVWRTLDQMREFKNLVFFKSITEKALEMFV